MISNNKKCKITTGTNFPKVEFRSIGAVLAGFDEKLQLIQKKDKK